MVCNVIRFSSARGARERHRPNLRDPGCPQRFSACHQSCASGTDVVHRHYRPPGKDIRFRAESVGHVLATFRHVEADLCFGVADAAKRARFNRNIQRTPNVIRQDARLVETALAQPFAREWYRRQKRLRGRIYRQRL